MNVAHAARDLGVSYPVALDNKYAIWRSLNNQYWPAEYLIDTSGRIRYRAFGEGHDAATEREIRALLTESGRAPAAAVGETLVAAGGAEAAPAMREVASPETYVGYRRAERWRALEPVDPDSTRDYTVADRLALNDWGLAGAWRVGPESAVLVTAPGRVGPVPRARPAPRARARTTRHADPFPRPDRRACPDGGSWERCRGRRQRHDRRTAAVPTRSTGRRRHGPDIRDRIPRPWRGRVRVHIRLNWSAASAQAIDTRPASRPSEVVAANGRGFRR